MDPTRLGWELATFDLTIKKGSAGSFLLTSVVTEQDGSALPSYAGWTASMKFDSPFNGRTVIAKSPSVTGSSGDKTLVTQIDFDASDTASLTPGTYKGDIFYVDPSTSKPYCPAQFNLVIEPSAS